jgi:hypothetical protein
MYIVVTGVVVSPYFSIVMDVTDKDSIREGVKAIESKEGKLHILVNKYVYSTIPPCDPSSI